MTEPPTPALRLGYVPGATPAKWARIWRERHSVPLELVAVPAADAARALHEGRCDMAIMRPPVDRDTCHVIALYDERLVVVVGTDHLLAALEPHELISAADVAEDVVLVPCDDVVAWPGAHPGRPARQQPETTSDAIAQVAAGVGVAVLPQSLARLHHRKDVTYRMLSAELAAPVILAWRMDRDAGDTQEFVGIVRGRTANSSRGSARSQPAGAAHGRAQRGRA